MIHFSRNLIIQTSFQESKFKETGVLTPEEVCISIFIYIKSFNIFHQKMLNDSHIHDLTHSDVNTNEA